MNGPQNGRLLSSWKEIAGCLGKGVRTVQRWEGLGLPVMRPAGGGKNVVLAVESDLRSWMEHSKPERLRLAESRAAVDELTLRLKKVREQTRAIHSKLDELERRLKAFEMVVKVVEIPQRSPEEWKRVG